MGMKLTDQLRKAIRKSGLSGYAICKATGINKSVLSRFLAGKVGLSAPSIDIICGFLRLDLVTRKTRKGVRK